ncbi:transposase [Cellulosimicrobium cellulans]|uniref:DUF6262 family protein n=1 Tax=Cellulosimicrobium cellulans TaxID=1710 RepID=UPI001EDBD3C6|nr:DUF6262 family protein [Cellulosimicrobium cellulans]UKJ63242.1 transposase [Cellulosimicrobium cellulans]UKJ63946.1 transposase [Cellulosimicrobium cellulans]
MRADNTHHLRAAAQRRARETRTRAEDALEAIRASGQSATVSLLARTAGVTRSWIYTQPDLLTAITDSAGATPRRAAPTTTASEKSWQRRLELAHARIADLTRQNQDLRHQLAITHGQLRAASVHRPDAEPVTCADS